mgnify:CR=1 FL=1
MKVKNLFALAVVMVLFAIGVQAQTPTTPQKSGYVNSEVILQQFPEAIKAQGELDTKIQEWNKVVDSLTAKLQEEYNNLQKQAQTMPEKKRNEELQKLAQQQQAIDEYRRTKFGQQTGEIYRIQEQLMGPVKQKIFAVIEVVAKEEGMTFVFDRPGDVLLLYADTQFDLTYKVLDKLKRGN